MRRKDLSLKLCLTMVLSLYLTVGALILPGISAVVKAEEVEETDQTEYTEQESYVLPEVGDTYPYGDYEFSYKVLSDNTVEIVSFSGGKSYGMDLKVDIPGMIDGKAVTVIGNSAFQNCVGISSITIPEGVVRIGDNAFSDCVGISSIIVPEGVTRIGDDAFSGCRDLSSITIPESVTSIGNSVFSECSNLNSIIIPKGVTRIGNLAFYKCSNLSSITIPEGVTDVGREAFYECSNLSSIKLPDGITGIGDFTFYGCSSLTSINIPDGVTSIGWCAFEDCSNLSSITIPEGVTSIQRSAFSGCSSLNSIEIPYGIARIEEHTFEGCSNLSSIIIPESVIRIERYAFYECSSLSSIIIPEGITSIEERTFSGCGSLTSITIPKGVTVIGDTAFSRCSSLTSFTIPENVTSIGDSAFLGCSSLTSFTIPRGVTSIGDNLFYSCSNLKSITLHENITSIGKYMFYDCKSLKSIVIPDGVTGIDEGAFEACSGLKSITIPESVTSIKGNAFYQCTGVTKVCNNSAVRIYLPNFNIFSAYVLWYDLATGERITELGTGTAVSQYYVDDTAVRDFVNRLYTLVLAREADEIGLESWTDTLIKKKSNGVDIGYGFVFSDECKEKNLSNEEFVEILYNTFMNRASDAGGKASWVSQLDAGVEREKVFAGFIYSVEFADICSEYKIKVGNVFEVGRLADALAHYRNQNADITKFVARCYTEALGREYEPDGLEAWCKVIIEKSNTPKQAAQSFIFSDEFLEKNLNNEEYVKVLYRTFMGREADEIGLAGWVEVLESGREDRMKVMEGFSDSVEFDGILQTFGLN